ncbi:MAG: hypothetical protein JWQ04_3011, partial [Pedosphaera sp.]|nr:hypothetical protein [Pedosphaera sp.]
AFKLIHDAQKYGARVALYGRKINNAEHQLAFIEMLLAITEGRVKPEEAVHAYHGILQAKNIKPHRSLEDDLKPTDQAMSYDGSAARRATAQIRNNPLANGKPEPTATSVADKNGTGTDWPTGPDGSPDFANMNSAQRRAYDTARLAKRFG